MKYKNLKITHRDLTNDNTSGHLQIQPQRNELTKFAKKKNIKEMETHKDKEEERREE